MNPKDFETYSQIRYRSEQYLTLLLHIRAQRTFISISESYQGKRMHVHVTSQVKNILSDKLRFSDGTFLPLR